MPAATQLDPTTLTKRECLRQLNVISAYIATGTEAEHAQDHAVCRARLDRLLDAYSLLLAEKKLLK